MNAYRTAATIEVEDVPKPRWRVYRKFSWLFLEQRYYPQRRGFLGLWWSQGPIEHRHPADAIRFAKELMAQEEAHRTRKEKLKKQPKAIWYDTDDTKEKVQ